MRVASRTYPKLPKKWSAESEANGLSCEAARENFSAGFNKTVHWSLYFKPLFLVFISWLLLLFKSFINNDMKTFGLSQFVAVSVTEVSDVDVDFTEVVLMLILYQQRSPIDCLLVLVIIDHIDIGWT